MGYESMCTMIENSDKIHDVFKDFVKSLETYEVVGGSDAANLGVAKHRFDSLSKRLGRYCGKILAVISTAEWVRIHRAGRKEAKSAEAFLSGINMKSFLLLSMMADAADEGYMFTLYCDDESCDVALMCDEISVFLSNGAYLWERAGCLETTGYTSFALRLCKTVRVINTKKAACPS